MPRITDARREARRADIVDAARRCFARDGFHQTSMPDIAREAGLSQGAFYRYFSGKDDIVVEIAGEAFGAMFSPVEELADTHSADTHSADAHSADAHSADAHSADAEPSAGDLVATAATVSLGDELLRCAIQAWSELLRNDVLRAQAIEGFERVRVHTAEALRRGQAAGKVDPALDPEAGARVIMALLHGFLLQQVAFGLTDVAAFVEAARALLRAGR